jgi:DNA-binding CsgD family transcriptional regulator
MLMGRAGLSPVMVGRSAELAALRGRVDALADHRGLPPVVVVSGEAGVGKTRLLRELTGQLAAERAEVEVLAAHADEGDLARPFGLLAEALSAVLPAWDPLPPALEPRAHALGHVLSPHLPEHPPADDHVHSADELLLAAVEAVRCAVDGRPSVLLLEDLHWADPESIGVLTRLAATPDLPLLIVGTYRPEDFDRRHPLARALPALERHRTVEHLPLGRLGDAELARMLEAILGRAPKPAAVAALHGRTQGNPFFVEELVAATGAADPDELADAPLPWNAAEAVLRRVDALDERPRRTLDAAAVLGQRIPFDRLAAVTGLDEDALIADLRDLVERGLLTESDPDVFAFRHALTREAVAGQLLSRERRRIHRAALAAVDGEATADLVAIARHAAGAGESERLVEVATSGAPKLLREGAGQQALALAELGLSCCDDLSDAHELGLRHVAARAAWHIGDVELAFRHANRWRRLAASEKVPAEESAALRQLALLAHFSGDSAGREAAIDEALAVAAPLGPSVELAWVHAYRSQSLMFARRRDESVDWADRALAMAEQVGAPDVVPYALVNKGTVLTELPGRAEEGLALLDEARRMALARHDAMTAARALNNAQRYLLELDEDGVERARELIAEQDRLLARYGLTGFAAQFATHRTMLAGIDGDLAAAEAALPEIETGDAVTWLVVVGYRVQLAAERGDRTAAVEALKTLAGDDRLVLGEEAFWYHSSRLIAAACAGDVETGQAAVDALLAIDFSDDRSCLWFPHLACSGVIVAAAKGFPEPPLRALLEAARRVPVELDVPIDEGWFVHAEAALAARVGDHEAALRGYEAVRELARRPRPAWARADRHLGMARSLAGLGRREEAAAEAAVAIDLLTRWPGWRRDEAIALHDRLTGASAGTGSGSGELTAREVEVLRLVAEGLSNREIAERLYIAPKTAAVHVSNILAKVGAASRTEAATWALRTGVLADDAVGSA